MTQMKSILSDMKTGYQIYQQGYGSISSLAKGNFSLHETYLNGLLAVSPSVKNYARIADILSLQASLVSEYKRKQALFRQSGSFSVGELSYISDVYARLVSQTLNDAGELADILMAGKLRMSDADRIRAIDRIYTGSSDRLQFLRSFNNQGMAISLQRSKESGDTRTLNRLYGIQ
ncbi:TerB family tellurite resistance protein [Mucilaginibacter sp. R11]|uniref:TerB family tellurite resistance protein n=1 Tax=Mucilaginibacter agri TaxID=2695265 RepID=A0A966DSB9_9SPHI|nr:TerB family tellurite resistance protein [Mucilaginibacter agri]